MSRALTTDHINEVAKNLCGSKHGSIHPTSSLLHENHHGLWRVCEGFSVWDICQLVSLHLLNVDLKAHDPVLRQVLVRLGARRYILPRLVLEESIQRIALDRLPTEQRVRTWQHLSEAKERLACFVRCMTELVFEELSRAEQVRSEPLRLLQVDLDFTAAPATIFVSLHMSVKFE